MVVHLGWNKVELLLQNLNEAVSAATANFFNEEVCKVWQRIVLVFLSLLLIIELRENGIAKLTYRRGLRLNRKASSDEK